MLDSIGWNIVKALQENARLSYAELGRQAGLTAPAVAERVRKLEEAGVITGYYATEVDQFHIRCQAAHDLLHLRRRRKGLRVGHVKMHIMAVQYHVRQ